MRITLRVNPRVSRASILSGQKGAGIRLRNGVKLTYSNTSS